MEKETKEPEYGSEEYYRQIMAPTFRENLVFASTILRSAPYVAIVLWKTREVIALAAVESLKAKINPILEAFTTDGINRH